MIAIIIRCSCTHNSCINHLIHFEFGYKLNNKNSKEKKQDSSISVEKEYKLEREIVISINKAYGNGLDGDRQRV